MQASAYISRCLTVSEKQDKNYLYEISFYDALIKASKDVNPNTRQFACDDLKEFFGIRVDI